MNNPLKLWLELVRRFDALSLRERLLITAAPLVILQLLWQHLLWSPLTIEQDLLIENITQVTSKINLADAKLKGLVARSRMDPNIGLNQQIDQVKDRLHRLDDQIRQAAESLIDPGQMARLLEELLANDQILRLVKLEKLKSEPLFTLAEPPKDGDSIATPSGNIYRHGFAIEFEGDYFSTLQYLQALEALPWGFFWDGVAYRVEQYPRARVRLLLHTLSLQTEWVGV